MLSDIQQIVDFLDSDDPVIKHAVVSLLACVKCHLSATELSIIEASSSYIFSRLLYQSFVHLGHFSAELF